jgi:hypothetical protein
MNERRVVVGADFIFDKVRFASFHHNNSNVIGTSFFYVSPVWLYWRFPEFVRNLPITALLAAARH